VRIEISDKRDFMRINAMISHFFFCWVKLEIWDFILHFNFFVFVVYDSKLLKAILYHTRRRVSSSHHHLLYLHHLSFYLNIFFKKAKAEAIWVILIYVKLLSLTQKVEILFFSVSFWTKMCLQKKSENMRDIYFFVYLNY
jgi:hypothetical protein